MRGSPRDTATEAFDERDPAYLWQPLLMRVHAYHYRLTERICIHIGGSHSFWITEAKSTVRGSHRSATPRRTVAPLVPHELRIGVHADLTPEPAQRAPLTRTVQTVRSALAACHVSLTCSVRKASAAVLQKLKQVGELADEAVEYVDAALQLDAPGAEAEAEEEEAVTIEAMEARINGLLGRATTKSTPLGVLPSGALPDLSLPERLDHGDTQEGDAGMFLTSQAHPDALTPHSVLRAACQAIARGNRCPVHSSTASVRFHSAPLAHSSQGHRCDSCGRQHLRDRSERRDGCRSDQDARAAACGLALPDDRVAPCSMNNSSA